MHTTLHQGAESRIDHSLPLNTVLALERGAFDAQSEVALPRGIVASVTAVLLAVVD